MADKQTNDEKSQTFVHENGTKVTAPASMADALGKQGFKAGGGAKGTGK